MPGEELEATCDTCGQPAWGHVPTSDDESVTGRWFCIHHAPSEFREKFPPIPEGFPPFLRRFFAAVDSSMESKKKHLALMTTLLARLDETNLSSDVKVCLRNYFVQLAADVKSSEDDELPR